MSKTITCGGVECGYEANHLYGFDLMPELYQRLLSNDEYDYDPATALTGSQYATPIKAIVMAKRGATAYKQNPDTIVPSLLGTAVHALFEHTSVEGYEAIREKRYAVTLDGLQTTAKIDLIYRHPDMPLWRIADFKTGKAGQSFFDQPSYTLQLSIGRLFAHVVDGIEIDDVGYIFKLMVDWDKWRKGDGSKYPSSPFACHEIKLMDYDTTTAFVRNKLCEYATYIDKPEEQIPECSLADLWQHRETGIFQRCKDYCKGRDVCQQYVRMVTDETLRRAAMPPEEQGKRFATRRKK